MGACSSFDPCIGNRNRSTSNCMDYSDWGFAHKDSTDLLKVGLILGDAVIPLVSLLQATRTIGSSKDALICL